MKRLAAIAAALTLGTGLATVAATVPASAAGPSVCDGVVALTSQTVDNGSYAYGALPEDGLSYYNGSYIAGAGYAPSVVTTYLVGTTMWVVAWNESGANQTFAGWFNFQTSC